MDEADQNPSPDHDSSASPVVSPGQTPSTVRSLVIQTSPISHDSPPLSKEAEATLLHEHVNSFISSMRSTGDLKVWTSLSGIDLTPETEQLAYRLQFYLDVKDISYYILESILEEHPLEVLKLEEYILEEEFSFYSIPDARLNFHSFVLCRMINEAKSLQVDLKPIYAVEAYLYNAACNLGSSSFPIFRSIPKSEPEPAIGTGSM